MAKTIDDYDNFINLLSNPENFRVYSIDDSIKTTTNISIKLIAVIRGNESNNYELKFINKKQEIPIYLRKYATDNPIYYNSNNLKCITSIHADDYEKNIYNIYHTTTTNLGEYIKYYIINNQDIIYEIKIYVPLIIIMNIINEKNTKIVLIDRTSKNFSETNKTQNCSIEIDLLKRISKKLFNIIDKYLKDTKFEGEIIKNLEEFNKITQLPSQSQESSSKVSALQAAVPEVLAGKEKKTQNGQKQQEVEDNKPQPSSKRQLVEPSAPQSGLPVALAAPAARPEQLGQVVSRPQGPQGPQGPSVLETTRVKNPKDYVEFCAIEVFKNINITEKSIIKENDDFYNRNRIVIVAPIDEYDDTLIKEIHGKFNLTFNKEEIIKEILIYTKKNRKSEAECYAMFKKYDKINIIYVINPNLKQYNEGSDSGKIVSNLRSLEQLINKTYINILKELIKNINRNSNIKELRIPINYNKKSAGNFYDDFKFSDSSNSKYNIIIPMYSFYALYNALNLLTQDDINLLTRNGRTISIDISSSESDYDYNKVITYLNSLKEIENNKFANKCRLQQKELERVQPQQNITESREQRLEKITNTII